MKMKNAEVEPLVEFLMSLELKGKQSRLRTRFVKLLAEQVQVIQDEHAELIKQYASFNDDGKPNIVEVNGVQMYDVKERNEFNKEYGLLLSEDYIVEQTESIKEMLLLVKDIILDCDMTFSGREALQYDRFCEIAEEINYE